MAWDAGGLKAAIATPEVADKMIDWLIQEKSGRDYNWGIKKNWQDGSEWIAEELMTGARYQVEWINGRDCTKWSMDNWWRIENHQSLD